MSIKLIHQIPSKDGYYLMRFHPTSGLHLVLIQTQLDGSRIMIPDNYYKIKKPQISLNEAHSILFKNALFSEEPIEIVV